MDLFAAVLSFIKHEVKNKELRLGITRGTEQQVNMMIMDKQTEQNTELTYTEQIN